VGRVAEAGADVGRTVGVGAVGADAAVAGRPRGRTRVRRRGVGALHASTGRR